MNIKYVLSILEIVCTFLSKITYVIASDFPQQASWSLTTSPQRGKCWWGNSYQLRPLLTTDNFQPKFSDLGDSAFMYHWSLEASDSGMSATDLSSSLTWWSGGLSASFSQCGWLLVGRQHCMDFFGGGRLRSWYDSHMLVQSTKACCKCTTSVWVSRSVGFL